MSSRWIPPKHWPRGTRISKTEDSAILGDSVPGRPNPYPVLIAELDLLERPTGSKVLPVHPFGALTLFERTRTVAKSLIERDDLSDAEWQHLSALIWERCHDCYLPGQPVRSAFDRLLERKPKPASSGNQPNSEDLAKQKLDLLAVSVVARGLLVWASSGESDVAA